MRKIKIEIGKKEIGFRFGLAFVGELLDETDLSIDEVVNKMTKNPFKMVPLIMFYSAKNYYERAEQTMPFTRYELSDLIDDNGGVNSKEVIDFLNAFTASMNKGVPKEKVKTINGVKQKAEVKKK
jgi:hypothetical protein